MTNATDIHEAAAIKNAIKNLRARIERAREERNWDLVDRLGEDLYHYGTTNADAITEAVDGMSAEAFDDRMSRDMPVGSEREDTYYLRRVIALANRKLREIEAERAR
jgi:hypothetical protein